MKRPRGTSRSLAAFSLYCVRVPNLNCGLTYSQRQVQKTWEQMLDRQESSKVLHVPELWIVGTGYTLQNAFSEQD